MSNREIKYYSEKIKRYEGYINDGNLPQNMKDIYKKYIERYERKIKGLEK